MPTNENNPIKPPIDPSQRIRRITRTERVMESIEYKKARLQDLTGIENESELKSIYLELVDCISKVEVKNIVYQENTVDSRGGTEKQLVFKNLNGEELADVEVILKKLRIFGFPESIEDSNSTDLVIENKRDLEVLRLLDVFRYIREEIISKIESQNKAKQREENERLIREWEIKHNESFKKTIEDAILELEEINIEHLEEDELEAKKEMYARLEKDLLQKYNDERQDAASKKNVERDKNYLLAKELLSKIEIQNIDIDSESLDDDLDVFKEVSGYRGFIPTKFPQLEKNKSLNITKEMENAYELDLDPIELDEQFLILDQKWRSGEIANDIENEITIPKINRPNLKIFPVKYKWVFDKIKKKNRLYEFDPKTKQLGKEIKDSDREDTFQRLKLLRDERQFSEDKTLPKTKEEKDLELKLILMTNNLIVWLINDLRTNSIRGNYELRNMDVNDLYQNAVMGLMKSIDMSDINKRTSVTSVPIMMAYMEGYMRRYHWEDVGYNFQPRIIHTPDFVKDNRNRINRIIRLLQLEFPGRKIEDVEIAIALAKPGIGLITLNPGHLENLETTKEGRDLLVSKYKDLRELYMMDYSEKTLDILDNDEIPIDNKIDMLAKQMYTKDEEYNKVVGDSLRKTFEEVLRSLPPREERVLRMRFGFINTSPDGILEEMTEEEKENFYKLHPYEKIIVRENYLKNNKPQFDPKTDTNGMSLEEVGNVFSVTRERIRQMEAKALRKLKHPSRSRKLRSFLDY